MPSSKQSYYIKVGGYLVLGGKEYDVSKVELEFSLGDVGRAEVYVPVGRVCKNSSRMNLISTSEGMLNIVQPMTEAVVYLQFTPSGAGAPTGRKLGFPPGKSFAVFRGFVQAPAQQRVYGGTANMVIKLFGYLGSLAGASSYSRDFNIVPTANASVGQLIGYGANVKDNIMDYYSIFYENITGDLWGNALYPILLNASDVRNAWTNNKSGAQVATAKALDRVNKGQFKDKPLALRIDQPDVQSLINRQLMRFFAMAIHVLWKYDKGWSGGNFFSVIKQLESAFMWTLVPGIDNDGLLAITQMLYSPYITIHPDEYYGESLSNNFNEDDWAYLTEIGVLPGTDRTTPWQESPTKAKFVGYATLSDLVRTSHRNSGLLTGWPSRISMIQAQPWMFPPSPDGKSGNNAGEALPDSWKSKPSAPPKTPDQQWSQLELKYTEANMGRYYAKATLANEIFYNRKMQFMGKARFDICPGSTIGVEVVEDPFSNVSPQVLYGLVESVRISVGIGDGNPNATTMFVLSSVRTANEQDAYTVDEHPMYLTGSRFIGAPLTQEADQ